MASLTVWTRAILCEQTLQRAVHHQPKLCSPQPTFPYKDLSSPAFPYLHVREFLCSDGHCWYLMGSSTASWGAAPKKVPWAEHPQGFGACAACEAAFSRVCVLLSSKQSYFSTRYRHFNITKWSPACYHSTISLPLANSFYKLSCTVFYTETFMLPSLLSSE